MEKSGWNNCRQTENKQKDRNTYYQTRFGKKSRQVCSELNFWKQKEITRMKMWRCGEKDISTFFILYNLISRFIFLLYTKTLHTWEKLHLSKIVLILPNVHIQMVVTLSKKGKIIALHIVNWKIGLVILQR